MRFRHLINGWPVDHENCNCDLCEQAKAQLAAGRDASHQGTSKKRSIILAIIRRILRPQRTTRWGEEPDWKPFDR